MKATKALLDGAVTLTMNEEEANALCRLTLWAVVWVKNPIAGEVFHRLKAAGASDATVEEEPRSWGVTPNA